MQLGQDETPLDVGQQRQVRPIDAVGAGASMPTTNDDVDTEDDVDVTHALMVEGKGFFRADEEKESAQQVKEKEFSQTHQCRSYSDVVKIVPTNALEESNRANCEENNSGDNDDDDVTVIILENLDDDDEMVGSGWIDQDSPEIQERRRNVLLRELQRVQRASFIHFLILCLIPTSLLFIVIATVLGEDEDCESTATTCAKEPRTFISKCPLVGK